MKDDPTVSIGGSTGADHRLSSEETVVARVLALSELAETATSYFRALNVGDNAAAASALAQLRTLCQERAAWIERARSRDTERP